MNRTLTLRWLSRLVAVTIGVTAIDSVLFTGSQLIGLSGWSFVLLVPLFVLLCSLAGVWGAIEMWRFDPLGWWVTAWFCVFSVLGSLAPYLIFGRLPELDALRTGWLLVLCVSLAFLFTP